MSLKTKKVLLRIFIAVLALIISFLYGFQYLLWLNDIHWDYNNAIFIPFFRTPDAYHYIAQIKEIYEGNYRLSNTYLAEYKNVERSPWPVLPYYLIVFIGKLFHLKVQYVIVLMDFALPPVTFLLAYLFLSTISGVRRISLLGAFILTLIPHILWLESLLSTGLRLLFVGPPILADAHCYYCFSRPINPQLTYPLLLAALLFFVKGLKTSKMRYGLVAMGFGGLVSYSYVYFSTYLYTFLGVVTIGLFLLKEYHAFQQSLVVFGATLIIAIPFWYSVFSFSNDSLNQVSWMYKSHLPILDVQFVLTIPICIYLGWRLLKKSIGIVLALASLSLLLSGIICLNQHVITGMNTQPEWHYNMFIRPQALILAITLLVSEHVKNRTVSHFNSKQRSLRFSKRTLVLLGGIALMMLSVLFRPAFVASQFSPDGNLSPKFALFLQMAHWGGLSLGGGLLIMSFLSRTRFHIFVHYLGETMLRTIRKGCQFISLSTPLKMFLYVTIIGYVSWDVGVAQYIYYRHRLVPQYSDLQQLSPALQWLNQHTEKESVILGNFDYASTGIITIYTDNNVYAAIHAQFYTVPRMDEFRDRLYNLMYFMGISAKEDFEQMLYNEPSRYIFLENAGLSFEEYQEKLKKDIYSELLKYRVDYLFYGPREQKNFRVNPDTAYPFLKKVYDDGIVKIYRIL